MAPLRFAAKLDPFLSLDCAPTPSTLAHSKERKGSNFAIWQPCYQHSSNLLVTTFSLVSFQGARVWVKDAVNVWKSATVTADYDGGKTLSVEGDEDAEQGRHHSIRGNCGTSEKIDRYLLGEPSPRGPGFG